MRAVHNNYAAASILFTLPVYHFMLVVLVVVCFGEVIETCADNEDM